jgi:RNA polymerase sigma factor (sigma-70 family)
MPESNVIIRPIGSAAAIRGEDSDLSESNSDEYTLIRIAEGDASAVAECMKRFSGLVWSLVRSKLGNSPEAEDLTQEIFIEVWKSASRFDPQAGSEAVFIATIARRRVIDRLRSIGRRPETEEFDESKAAGETGAYEQIAVDAGRAQQALEQIRDDQRQLILMGVVEGLTHSEIATATGKPLGTVKTQMRRGLAKVRSILDGDLTTEESGTDNG